MSTKPRMPRSSVFPAMSIPPICMRRALFCIRSPLSPLPMNCLMMSLYALTRITLSFSTLLASGLLVAATVATPVAAAFPSLPSVMTTSSSLFLLIISASSTTSLSFGAKGMSTGVVIKLKFVSSCTASMGRDSSLNCPRPSSPR